jgi:prepilin-type N-terminal cleavage/methylation domain-containing protein
MNQGTARRSAFTLVELLMVISILAVLGAMSLTLIRGARHDANAARTETQIRRIKAFIEARLEDYAVRVLPYRLRDYDVGGTPLTPAQISELRNRILVEYIRAEMPCRLEQVSAPVLPPFNRFPSPQFITDYATVGRPLVPGPGTSLLIDEMRNDPPALVRRMSNKKLSLATTANEQAECLFEIMNSYNDYGSSGMDFIFSEEVRDVDNDTYREILDAWGDPLEFTIHVGTDESSDLSTTDPVLIDLMKQQGPLAVHVDVTSIHLD